MDNAMYNATYNIGRVSRTQDELNNRMSGTDANAMYYATHGGTGNSNYVTGANTATSNPGSYVDFGKRGTLTTGGGKGTAEVDAQAMNGGFDLAAYLEQLAAQRRAQAEAAYEKAMGILANAYDDAAGNYKNIYDTGVGTLGKSYDNSLNKINENASQAMREAYINKMLSRKDLGQQLAAMGVTGGATESAIAGLENNYGNARNNIQRTWDTNRSDLELGYNNNLADLYSAYQSQLANLRTNRATQEAQLLANLNNSIASISDGLASSLMAHPELLRQAAANANDSLQGITPTEAVANNPYTPVSTTQANDVGGNLTNWWKYIQGLDNAGTNAYDITKNLITQGLSNDQIANLLNSYYAA